MKSINIQQIANGWLVTKTLTEDTHAFRTVAEIQEALPWLLGDKPTTVDPVKIPPYGKPSVPGFTAEQCLESHKKAVEEFEKGNKLPGQY
jgi:hypothetical protein